MRRIALLVVAFLFAGQLAAQVPNLSYPPAVAGPTGATGATGSTGSTGPTGAAGPGPAFGYADADQTVTNSAAYVDDAKLKFTPTSGKKYRITIDAPYTDSSAAALAGVHCRIGGTATYNNFLGFAEVLDLSSSGATFDGEQWTAPLQVAAGAGGAGTYLVRIRLTVEVNVGGTFIYQWSQSTAMAANLVRLRGSVLTYQEIP